MKTNTRHLRLATHATRATLAALLACAAACLSSCENNPTTTESTPASSQAPPIENPLPVAFGDPYILRASNDIYYMIGTGGVKDGFKMYSSSDLREWKDEGRIFQGNTADSWCVANFWAPELYEIDGKFYLLYSADWRHNPTNEGENFRIGVAVADTPTGPYTDLHNRPIFDPGYPIIDGNLFFEDGRVWLYYSRCCYKNPVESEVADWARERGMFQEIEESWVYGVEMKPDFSGILGEPVLLLRPPMERDDPQTEWESRSVTSGEVNRRWTEGSYLFKDRGTYYMMYSANFFGGRNYAVGYATSDSPLGPFRKAAENPILQKNVEQGGVVTGTGHNSLTLAPDGKTLLCVYHARTTDTGDERMVFIDPMEITAEGRLVVHGPTVGGQPPLPTP
jgi:beta-xylosidase